MLKKGQGLSLNTIIIAIIVLTVLVVIILIFTGVLGRVSPDYVKCENNAGYCASGTSCPSGESKASFICQDKTQICCIKSPLSS